MKKNYVFLAVTPDRLELPIAVGETAKDLAEQLGTNADNIHSKVWHTLHDKVAKRKKHKQMLIYKIDVGEDKEKDMTYQEAIYELKEEKALYLPADGTPLIPDTPDDRLVTAIDMAIDVLRQVANGELIGRTECMETTVAETMTRFREFIEDKPLGIDREYQTFLIGVNGSWEDAIEGFVKEEENR